MTKPIEEILAPKPEARPRLYACAIDDAAHAGLLEVGQTTRDVKQRVAELRTGRPLTGMHLETFPMRAGQEEAVEKTLAYHRSIRDEGPDAVPRFLWNTKMRFAQDVHRVPAREAARRSARARGHLQAGRRGRVTA